MKKLTDLKESARNINYIEYQIRYERSSGIHTYHQCDCNRKACRWEMCDICWNEYLGLVKSNRKEIKL